MGLPVALPRHGEVAVGQVHVGVRVTWPVMVSPARHTGYDSVMSTTVSAAPADHFERFE